MSEPTPQPAPKPLHDAAYVAEVIGKTRNWVERKARDMPHTRFGRSYRFSDEDIKAIIEQYRQRPETAAKPNMRPVRGRRSA